MLRDPTHSDKEGADLCGMLSGAGGSEGHSGPARSLDHRRPAGSCTPLLPLQYRRAHTGSARGVAAGDPLRVARVCAPLRQGAERTAVPAVAGNGITAEIAAPTAAESRQRTDLRQSLRRPAWRIGCPL